MWPGVREISKMLSAASLTRRGGDEAGNPGCDATQSWVNRKGDKNFGAAVVSRKDDGKMCSAAVPFIPMLVSRNAAGVFSQICRRWQNCSGISDSGGFAGDCRK